jgi:hypothetical protein
MTRHNVMKHKPIKITREELLKIKRAAHREAEISEGIGVDRKNQVFVDRKKEQNKKLCRGKKLDD